jgi:hypothetical protein
MLKGKISRRVGNSSEDSLYKFIVVSHNEGGNFLKIEHLSKTSLFWHFRRSENRIYLWCVKWDVFNYIRVYMEAKLQK